MRRKLAERLACLALTLALGGCYDDVKVVQGSVISTNPNAGTITVRDERPPNAELTYRNAGSKAALVGDVVRIAFREQGDGAVVVRLMNLRQRRALAEEAHK
jgi:hypothetical protein